MMPPSSHTNNEKSTKRDTPTEAQQDFIDLLIGIRVLRVKTLDGFNLNGNQTVAEALLEAVREDGEEGFWRTYDALASKRHPELATWRKLVAGEPPPEEQEAEKPHLYRPVTLLDMARRPRPGWVIDDVIYEKTVGVLFGGAGTRKTFLAFDWCAHVALGKPWQGHAIAKPGKVVYLVAEGVDNFIARALAWCAHYHVSLETLSEHLLIVPRELPLANAAEVSAYIGDVREYLQTISPVIVTFDTLMRCSGGENINAPDIMETLFDGANRIRRELDAAHVLIVHHEGKDSTRGGAGSFVLRANCDIVHRLTYEQATETLTVSCSQEVGGKMKDKPEHPDIYLKTQVVYYTDDCARDESSLVIVEGTKPARNLKLNVSRQTILDALPENGSTLRFTEWKQAVDAARAADTLGAMAKQTFIDNMKWLLDHRIVEKCPTMDTGTETGTDINTYRRVQEWQGGAHATTEE